MTTSIPDRCRVGETHEGRILVAQGGFSNDASVLRIITAVCVEQHEEWIAGERRYLSEQSMAQLRTLGPDDGLQAAPSSLMA